MISPIVGAALSFVLAIALTPLFIRVLRARGIGQPIHDDVHHHSVKAGTPTMGGLVIPIAVLTAFPIAILVAGDGISPLGLAAAGAVVAMGAVGLVDDAMKVLRERNVGLRERQKSVLQTLISLAFALTVTSSQGACTQLALVSCDRPVFQVPEPVFVLFVMVVFWGGTNAVNFADGIEGLLAGAATVTFAALAGIGFWVFRHPSIYAVPHALDFALVAACLAGAACGLLWWNINPRTIFMGDTGSLALGAGLVVVCVGLGVTLLIPVVGALYVVIGASSFLQRAWFRWTRRRGEGRRLFRMAPLHHHFEMVGWSEPTIVIRFWILNAIAAGAAILVFYVGAIDHLPG